MNDVDVTEIFTTNHIEAMLLVKRASEAINNGLGDGLFSDEVFLTCMASLMAVSGLEIEDSDKMVILCKSAIQLAMQRLSEI